MSIELCAQGTKPRIRAGTMHGGPKRVYLSGGGEQIELSFDDVLLLCSYVLTNVDLDPDDERLNFVEAVKRMKVVAGWNPGRHRLSHPATGTMLYRAPDAPKEE